MGLASSPRPQPKFCHRFSSFVAMSIPTRRSSYVPRVLSRVEELQRQASRGRVGGGDGVMGGDKRKAPNRRSSVGFRGWERDDLAHRLALQTMENYAKSLRVRDVIDSNRLWRERMSSTPAPSLSLNPHLPTPCLFSMSPRCRTRSAYRRIKSTLMTRST